MINLSNKLLYVLHPVYLAGWARILPAKPENTALVLVSGKVEPVYYACGPLFVKSVCQVLALLILLFKGQSSIPVLLFIVFGMERIWHAGGDSRWL